MLLSDKQLVRHNQGFIIIGGLKIERNLHWNEVNFKFNNGHSLRVVTTKER